MAQTIVQVDAFAERPFTGNPAAVCVLSSWRPDAWMQAVAAEMNLSETAFLVREEDGGWHLRWFTPAVEVDLCGHATLASAHVLWEDGHLASDDVARFSTRSGRLTARRADGLIWLDFPAQGARAGEPPAGLLDGLGLDPGSVLWVGRNRDDWLVQVGSVASVEGVRPDFGRLASVECRGVIVTAAGFAAAGGSGASDDGGADFVSRFFGPRVGVPEDPVTGSAHCCLAPFWAERLGRTEMVGWQASARGGAVRVRLAGDRVELGGRAVTVLRGELVEPPG